MTKRKELESRLTAVKGFSHDLDLILGGKMQVEDFAEDIHRAIKIIEDELFALEEEEADAMDWISTVAITKIPAQHQKILTLHSNGIIYSGWFYQVGNKREFNINTGGKGCIATDFSDYDFWMPSPKLINK